MSPFFIRAANMSDQPIPYFEQPLFFFDQGRFRKNLSEQNPIGVFKDAISAANIQFDRRFEEGEDISNLIYERALFIDCMLHYAWRQYSWLGGISLVAVGGYGRGELHPKSDIDLLILLSKEQDGSNNADNIEQFLTLLWDIGLEIGHSVRTVEQCVDLARNDISVATALTESRSLNCEQPGCPLREQLVQATGPDNIWSPEAFFQAKWDEQQARHNKHNNTEYNLEPNIKNAPGGLRDIQTISWVAKRFFGVRTLRQLQGKGFFTEDEFAILKTCEEFLWRVRYGLHMIAKRPEERLLFDHQRDLATLFGYKDNDKSLAVEQFMHRYYRIALALRELNDVLLQFLNEAIFRAGASKSVIPLNERFQLRDGFIEVCHIYVFDEEPSALLEIFVLMAQNPKVKGVRASTIRLIRERRHLIDDDFRHNNKNCQLFMELFQHPQTLPEQLKRMKRYGVLGRYLPEFGKVVGQMQHDLFHIYTVDAHTQLVVQNICRFHDDDTADQFPIAHHIVKRISRPDLLIIAGLYHDIAKGRGGDHSTLGAVDAEAFGQRHGLSSRATRLVCWLVERHLLMSQVSQKQDLSDPEVIHNFALEMGDQLHLDYLYALTCADINATNPDLWTSWRASLMRQLYMETKRALRRGLENTIDKQDLIEETQDSVISKLADKGLSEQKVRALWGDMGEDYFLRESHHDIAWHTEAIAEHLHSLGCQKELQPCDQLPLILIKESSNYDHEGATQIFIHTQERANVFTAVATGLDQLNLSIQDARIYNSPTGYTIDTFFVLNEDGEAIGESSTGTEKIRKALLEELALVDEYSEIITRRTPRQLKHFTMPTETNLSCDIEAGTTVLEVNCPDRPGLLARIGRIFLEFDIQLQNAKIATLGERVEDIFYITDKHGDPIKDEAISRVLQAEICRQLDQQVDAQ